LSEDFSDIHVVISVPTRDVIAVQTAGWILEAVKKATILGYKIGVHFVYSPYPIEVQRNNQVVNFLEDKRFTHIFFLDSDCCPPGLTIEKLLDYDKDIVCSVAPALINGRHVFTAATFIPPEKRVKENECYSMPLVTAPEATGFKKVDVCGMTGVLIKREVFEKLEQPWFKMCYDKNSTSIEMGEDYYFCNKATEAGYEVWADFDLRQQHFKTVAL
jgi:hypothetical protein